MSGKNAVSTWILDSSDTCDARSYAHTYPDSFDASSQNGHRNIKLPAENRDFIDSSRDKTQESSLSAKGHRLKQKRKYL